MHRTIACSTGDGVAVLDNGNVIDAGQRVRAAITTVPGIGKAASKVSDGLLHLSEFKYT